MTDKDKVHLGMGVMIGMLSGNKEAVETIQASLGKTIANLELKEDDRLYFTFTDGSGMVVFDDGQSCCESRYMRTDDRLSDALGAVLLNLEVRDGPVESGDYGSHDIQFLLVTTRKSVLTFSSHNEHNGYYGGFWIVAKPWTPGTEQLKVSAEEVTS